LSIGWVGIGKWHRSISKPLSQIAMRMVCLPV
jgi:hypothetical protein